MAIDTRDKRQSAMNFDGIGLNVVVAPNADGSVDDPDKQHQLDCYSGISFGAVVAGIADFLPRHRRRRRG